MPVVLVSCVRGTSDFLTLVGVPFLATDAAQWARRYPNDGLVVLKTPVVVTSRSACLLLFLGYVDDQHCTSL